MGRPGPQISREQIAVANVFFRSPEWMDSGEAAKDSKVCRRTTRSHCAKLEKLGILERADGLFLGFRYRLSPHPNLAYLETLRLAAEQFGVPFDCGESIKLAPAHPREPQRAESLQVALMGTLEHERELDRRRE